MTTGEPRIVKVFRTAAVAGFGDNRDPGTLHTEGILAKLSTQSIVRVARYRHGAVTVRDPELIGLTAQQAKPNR